jgi:hypothetical protein
MHKLKKLLHQDHTYVQERWGLKDGEGKLRIETSGGE